MLLGVVSDTHGHVPFTLEAVRVLDSFDVQQVLHCGDIGSVEIPRLFGPWPTHFVFGNVDRNPSELRGAIEQAGHTCHGDFGSLCLAGVRIAWLHGDDVRCFQKTIESGRWDLVCYGHTHRAEHHRHGPTLVLNPGAICRANPHSIAVVDLPTLEVNCISLSRRS